MTLEPRAVKKVSASQKIALTSQMEKDKTAALSEKIDKLYYQRKWLKKDAAFDNNLAIDFMLNIITILP